MHPVLCTQPHSLWVDVSMWAAAWLVIAIRPNFCDKIFQLCCPLRFLSSPLTPPVRVSYCLERQVSIQKSFVSFLIFVFCPTSFWRDSFAFLGIRGPRSTFKSYSMGVAPHAGNLLMYFFGERVVSLSYFSAIFHFVSSDMSFEN